MALFKAVKKPLIRQASAADTESSPLRPKYVPKTAPCAAGCPIGCDVRGMLTTLADAQVEGRTTTDAAQSAWQRITARNPFPAVCGRLCSQPCETDCYRSLKEGAVAVRAVERFLGDYAIERNLKFVHAKQLQATVAVTGAGPAGLSTASCLVRRGYKVTVFESSGRPGGSMRSNVPDEILDAEILRILDLGVELKCNCGEADVESLRAAYGAVIETTGLDGSEPSGVAWAIARGIAAAEDADARLRGGAPPKPAAKIVVPKERLRLEWYQEKRRHETATAFTAEEAVDEARRCMSCGMCLGEGNCWMYCTKGGFEKVPSGRRYKLNLERCNGCSKCADGCPSGYIEMA